MSLVKKTIDQKNFENFYVLIQQAIIVVSNSQTTTQSSGANAFSGKIEKNLHVP